MLLPLFYYGGVIMVVAEVDTQEVFSEVGIKTMEQMSDICVTILAEKYRVPKPSVENDLVRGYSLGNSPTVYFDFQYMLRNLGSKFESQNVRILFIKRNNKSYGVKKFMAINKNDIIKGFKFKEEFLSEEMKKIYVANYNRVVKETTKEEPPQTPIQNSTDESDSSTPLITSQPLTEQKPTETLELNEEYIEEVPKGKQVKPTGDSKVEKVVDSVGQAISRIADFKDKFNKTQIVEVICEKRNMGNNVYMGDNQKQTKQPVTSNNFIELIHVYVDGVFYNTYGKDDMFGVLASLTANKPLMLQEITTIVTNHGEYEPPRNL